MRVLITGVAGTLGHLLAERLIAEPGVGTVIGLDAKACRPPVPGMAFVRVDLRQPDWIGLLHDVDSVIHLAGMGWPLSWRHRADERARVEGTQALLTALGRSPVRRLLTVNNMALYGPQPAGPIRETAPVNGYSDGGYARARAQVEDLLSALLPTIVGVSVARLRTAWPSGRYHQALVRYFSHSPVLACGREDRLLNIVHEDDLVDAVVYALRHGPTGIFNVGSSAGLSFQELAALVGQSRACVPLAWIVWGAWWRWRWRGQRTPPGWVQALYHSQPLATAALSAAGWSARYSARDAAYSAWAALQAST